MSGSGRIFLTGASRGIGAVIALELARRGYVVGCFSRGGKGPENLEIPSELRERLVYLKGDIVDRDAVRAALANFVVDGPIAGVINNAGIHLTAPAEKQAQDEFDRVMTTNANATFGVCQEAFPHLVAAGGGIIINIGSFFDKMGVRHNAAYCASKAAIAAITRCLAVEWAPKKIRAVCVAPGYIRTDLNKDFFASEKTRSYLGARIPTGGPGEAIDVAKLVAALFDADIPYLTGETIYLDGGQSIAH